MMSEANHHITPQIRKDIDDRMDAWILQDEPTDFAARIMVEHDQFMALLETTYNTVTQFVNGHTTLGALQRLAEDINAALPATLPATGRGDA